MVGRDIVPRAALLVEPEPPLALLPEVVRPPHADDRAHPRDAVEHYRDERPVAQTRERARVDRLEEPARLGRREHRRRARRDDVRRPRTAAAGFTGITWLTTSQSPSMRMAARCCLTVGADPGWVRM